MQFKNLLKKGIGLLFIGLSFTGLSQVPGANFSISPNPVCSGAANVVQITDLSSGAPTSWSYTLSPGGPGPGGGQPIISTVQNPTVTYNQPGTFTITLIATNASGSSSAFTQTIQVLASPNAGINPGNQNTCIGGAPINLLVTTGGGPGGGGGVNTYSWSTGATTSSITVSPSATTIYSCIITATNGCSVERTTTVTVGTPTLTITSIPTSICPGSSCTLTATGQGPGPSTYSWSTGATTRTVTTNTPGVYTASFTNSSGCSGTFSLNLGTSTTLSLTATANPTAICVGGVAQLRVVGATNYTWSNGSNAGTQTVSPTANTTYTVLGDLGTCSGVTTVSLEVSVSPTLVVSASSTSVCAGNSVALNVSGASSYTWVQSGSNTPSIVASPSVNTTYIVRGANPGCTVRTSSINITVAAKPVLSVSSSSVKVCAGEQVALAVSGANTYSWSNGLTSAVTIITPTATTTYTVYGTGLDGCVGMAAFTQSVNACTGLITIATANSAFQLYPNPNNGSFVIKADSDLMITIINETGAVIKVVNLNESNNRSIILSGLESGIYFVYGQNGSSRIQQKLVILK